MHDDPQHTAVARLEPEEGLVARRDRLDFRSPRRVGATILNHAFTSLTRDTEGRARVLVTEGDGRGVEISWDSRCPWVQVYTADAPGSVEHRRGLAVEPMTCPPDALNSQIDLLVIQPGGTVAAGWGILSI